MLNIKTAAEAKQEWEERTESEVEKAICGAQERWETQCIFSIILPSPIIKQLKEKGYRVNVDDGGTLVSWA